MTFAQIREFHMAPPPRGRGWSDCGYHFACVNDFRPGVLGSWAWVTGRPVEQVGAHAKGFNAHSIGVLIEGNYSVTDVPADALAMATQWVAYLCRTYGVPVSRVFPHRDVGTTATECPGTRFPWKAFIAGLEAELVDYPGLRDVGATT